MPMTERILLATDVSTRSDRAWRRATMTAKTLGASVSLVHVVDSDQPAGPQGPDAAKGELQGPGHGSEPAEARRLHPCLYDDPEKAELGAPHGCQGPPDQPARSHHLHPRRRPQPPGTQRCADPRRPCTRPSRRALSRPARRARHPGGEGPQAEPFEVRREASQVTFTG